METNGIGIWIAFKVALIMPLSAAYAWYLTQGVAPLTPSLRESTYPCWEAPHAVHLGAPAQ